MVAHACSLLVVSGTLMLSACGGNDRPVVTDAGQPGAQQTYDLTEAEGRLEGTAIDVSRTGGDSDLSDEITPSPADSQQYATRSGAKFDLLIFRTPRDAKDAGPSLAQTEVLRNGGAYTRAGNLVAVTPRGPKDRDAYTEIFALFRALGGNGSDSDLATGSALTASSLAGEGDNAIGRTVTVRGPVGELLPNGGPVEAFFLGGSAPGARLLVVPADPKLVPAEATAPRKPGAQPPVLEVSGTVRPVSELGPYAQAGGRGFLKARTTRPALLAQSVKVATG